MCILSIPAMVVFHSKSFHLPVGLALLKFWEFKPHLFVEELTKVEACLSLASWQNIHVLRADLVPDAASLIPNKRSPCGGDNTATLVLQKPHPTSKLFAYVLIII